MPERALLNWAFVQFPLSYRLGSPHVCSGICVRWGVWQAGAVLNRVYTVGIHSAAVIPLE